MGLASRNSSSSLSHHSRVVEGSHRNNELVFVLEHEKIVDDISMEFYNLLGHALHLHCKEICFSSFDHPRLDLLLEMKPNHQKC